MWTEKAYTITILHLTFMRVDWLQIDLVTSELYALLWPWWWISRRHSILANILESIVCGAVVYWGPLSGELGVGNQPVIPSILLHLPHLCDNKVAILFNPEWILIAPLYSSLPDNRLNSPYSKHLILCAEFQNRKVQYRFKSGFFFVFLKLKKLWSNSCTVT